MPNAADPDQVKEQGVAIQEAEHRSHLLLHLQEVQLHRRTLQLHHQKQHPINQYATRLPLSAWSNNQLPLLLYVHLLLKHHQYQPHRMLGHQYEHAQQAHRQIHQQDRHGENIPISQTRRTRQENDHLGFRSPLLLLEECRVPNGLTLAVHHRALPDTETTVGKAGDLPITGPMHKLRRSNTCLAMWCLSNAGSASTTELGLTWSRKRQISLSFSINPVILDGRMKEAFMVTLSLWDFKSIECLCTVYRSAACRRESSKLYSFVFVFGPSHSRSQAERFLWTDHCMFRHEENLCLFVIYFCVACLHNAIMHVDMTT